MNVGIIGCGLVGHKRARCLGRHRLAAVADVEERRARDLANLSPGVSVVSSWQDIMGRTDVDVVFISTPHHMLTPIALEAVKARKHVLLEKPAARSASELTPLLAAAQDNKVCVKVGFNHRFHPAFVKARQYVDEGALGDLMFIRARYGHGGRVGYEKEWRADPAMSGGGELLDQGIHLIDLSRWFLGEFPYVDGFVHTYFWDMPVDDNAFVLLRTHKQQVAWLHASWTEWKNTFSYEIYGRAGKLHVEGLGGSYGMERLTYYKMSLAMGPPETVVHEFPDPDESWEKELNEFTESIAAGRQPCGNLDDAMKALEIVDTLYGARRR